ncbi:MAG TPA: hypothetical protein PK466_15040, partial [Thermotogota bacterium]|nr:hypothetical protein [Thermotogota bacterium]
EVEEYAAIVVKAYKPIVAPGFYEQWQWPIFVDTKGPEIDMFRMEEIDRGQKDEEHYDHLKVDKKIAPSLLSCCPSTVERWVGFEARDSGGFMFELEKGYLYTGIDPVVNVNLRSDRRFDLCSDAAEVLEDCGTFRGHNVQLRAFDSYYKLFQTENINNSFYTRRLGFPGDHPSVNTYDDPVSSLKYLTRPVREYEDLEITAPWHEYYTDLAWGNYDGSNLKTDPREISEIAFFNNIDLLNGLWENNEDVTMKELVFSLRDELGNTGEWRSYLSRKSIVELYQATATADSNCRGGLLSVSATSNLVDGHEEKIKSIRVIEKESGDIKQVIEGGVLENIPTANWARSVTEEFDKADVFVPAYQWGRELQIIVNTENDTEMAKSINITARYAGERPELEIGMAKLRADGNIRSLRDELRASGDEDMILLLGQNEDYYLSGFDYPKNRFDTNDYKFVVSLDYLANDDNVDRYLVDYTLEASDSINGGGYAFEFDAYLDAKDEYKDTLNLEMDFGLQSPPLFQHGLITAEFLAWDCVGAHPYDAREIEHIMYQNPYTFVEEVYAVQISEGASEVRDQTFVPEATSGIANGIYIRLQSDILFRDEEELKTKFNFERNGVTFENFEVFPKVEISGLNDRRFKKVSGAYLPNRAREFVIRVSPFSAALNMARSITGTMNGFTYALNNLRTISAGEIDVIIGANK